MLLLQRNLNKKGGLTMSYTNVKVNPHYITDNTGKKISVVLTMNDFKSIMDELEELEDIKLYDEAKKSNEPSIPIDKAFEIIELNRNVKYGL